MDGETCATCRFWERCEGLTEENDEYDFHEGESLGRCRRFPRVWVGRPDNRDPSPESVSGGTWFVDRWELPVTYDCDWCGEYQPRKPPPAT